MHYRKTTRSLLFKSVSLLLMWLIFNSSNYSYCQNIDSVKNTLTELVDSSISKQLNRLKSPDSMFSNQLMKFKKATITGINAKINTALPKKGWIDSSIKTLQLPLVKFDKKAFKINNGFIAVNSSYRSKIDTPFSQTNVLQHNFNGSVSMSIFEIPLKINWLLRRGNSTIFKNINDIQIEYDAFAFSNSIAEKLKTSLLGLSGQFVDSLTIKELNVQQVKLLQSDNFLNNALNKQKLQESLIMISMPELSKNPALSDSANNKIQQQQTEIAKVFIAQYNKIKSERTYLSQKYDSINLMYSKMMERMHKYEQLVKEATGRNVNSREIMQLIKQCDIKVPGVVKHLSRLSNFKRFGIGRNQLNYSELTSKNVSLSGVTFEYNSWYYVSFSAGTVNYRYRDFVLNQETRNPQFLVLTRLGVGDKDKTHFIVSFYKGRKQLYAVTNSSAQLSTVDIAGASAELKYQFDRNAFFIGEYATSISPDFRKNPITNTKFGWSDQSNKAMSFKVYKRVVRTGSIVEAMYKYTGVNYQSFSTYQPNAAFKSWYVKVDQKLLKNSITIAAALKSNEFTNPYITQNYKANTVFKSLQITYRSRHLPTVSFGYVPTSQVNLIGSQLIENRFYSLLGYLSHSYKVGERKANSSFYINRYYNNESDTSFAYYNSTNVFFSQAFYFDYFSMHCSYSSSKNKSYQLDILEGGLKFKLFKASELGLGLKFNNFNNLITETGGYLNARLVIKKLGMISVQYDNGFLPGSYQQFIRNEWMNIGYTRFF